MFGASGFAHHVDRDQFFAVNGVSLVTVDSTLQNTVGSAQTLQVDGTALTTQQVRGLVFDEDVLFVAYKEGSDGKVSVSKLVESVTTLPRGLAFSDADSTLSGQAIGRAQWALVDGDPLDKILKIDPDTQQLDTDFDTDGAADAPSADTAGVTFLDGFLYIASNERSQFGPDQRKVYKVSATTGLVSQIFNLEFINDDITGISNDGTDLFIFKTQNDRVNIVDISGSDLEDRFFNGLGQGAGAAAFRVGANQVLAADGSEIFQFTIEGNDQFLADSFNTSLNNIRGMAFDLGVATGISDDVLFMAHETTGQISQATFHPT